MTVPWRTVGRATAVVLALIAIAQCTVVAFRLWPDLPSALFVYLALTLARYIGNAEERTR